MAKLSPKTKKVITISLSALVVVSLVIVVTSLINTQAAKNQQASSSPNFSAVLPNGKAITSLGGWQKLTPPNSDPVYVFTDSINAVSISVSQQPLPDTFKANTAKSVSELAKSYSATDELDANGVKVYIGTSAKGPQSVIFTKNNLLILIKSQARIKNDAWVNYIKSLS